MRVHVLQAGHDEEVAVVEHGLARGDRRSLARRPDMDNLPLIIEAERMVLPGIRLITREQHTAAHMRHHRITSAACRRVAGYVSRGIGGNRSGFGRRPTVDAPQSLTEQSGPLTVGQTVRDPKRLDALPVRQQ